MSVLLRLTWNSVVILVLTVTVLAGRGNVERTGDYLQVVLPVTAFACSVANGEALSNFLRFVATGAVIHGSKRGLGDAEINLRPHGGLHGFPSGHTAAAAFGASSLVNSCIKKNPVVQAVVILSGGFVGASRIEAGAHFLFQVLAGGLLGWVGERILHFIRLLSSAFGRRNWLLARKQPLQ